MSTKWCRFEVNGQTHFGKIEGEQVLTIDGTPWGSHTVTTQRHALSACKLLAPTIPSTFFCVGINYREHIIEIAKRNGVEPVFPQRPDVGYRAQNALCGHDDAIIKPKNSGELFQYEGELVVVIGKEAKNVSAEQALDYVFGYTIGNDVSERTWQKNDRTLWRAKNCDTFKPMGPWIVTDLDYRGMTTTIRLNGEVVDSFATAKMIHDVETYIAEISQYCTLYPGDVIWMGTEGAQKNMKPGDICEIEITGIGTLRNPIVAES